SFGSRTVPRDGAALARADPRLRLGLRGARLRRSGTRGARRGFRARRGQARAEDAGLAVGSRAARGFFQGRPRPSLRSRLRKSVPVLAAAAAAGTLRGARGAAARHLREDRGVLLLRRRRARAAVRTEIGRAGATALGALRGNRGQGGSRLDPDFRRERALEDLEGQKYFATDLRSTLPPE